MLYKLANRVIFLPLLGKWKESHINSLIFATTADLLAKCFASLLQSGLVYSKAQ